MILVSIVLLISGSVLGFAKRYMSHEVFTSRFLGLVVLFVLRINILVFIPNLVAVLLGWDGLGLVSYLLVIYYSNPRSLRAGILTVIRNRLGDAFILIGIGLLIRDFRLLIINIRRADLWLVVLLLMFAAFTKRAQFPFCS